MLLVRTDANANIGVGHAMRCLALAEGWLRTEDEHVTFAMATDTPSTLVSRIERAGASVEQVNSVDDTVALAHRLRAEWVVVDGYHLKAALQRPIADTGATLLVIDDGGETASEAASLVLNQNPYASPKLYEHLANHPDLLLGTEYALLRREFADGITNAASEAEERTRPLRVLVSLGGADPRNLTPVVIEAVTVTANEIELEADVIVGAANPHGEAIAKAVDSTSSRGNIRIHTAVDDMATRMRNADIAIVAAGSTCWELASMGVPMFAVVTAENQRPVASAVEELGIGISLGESSDLTIERIRTQLISIASDHDARERMASRGRQLIDGHGAVRVCDALRRHRTRKVKEGVSR